MAFFAPSSRGRVMAKAKKAEAGNPVGWFEIPATDLKRAKKFYEGVFGVKLSLQTMGPCEMAWFPMGLPSWSIQFDSGTAITAVECRVNASTQLDTNSGDHRSWPPAHMKNSPFAAVAQRKKFSVAPMLASAESTATRLSVSAARKQISRVPSDDALSANTNSMSGYFWDSRQSNACGRYSASL